MLVTIPNIKQSDLLGWSTGKALDLCSVGPVGISNWTLDILTAGYPGFPQARPEYYFIRSAPFHILYNTSTILRFEAIGLLKINDEKIK